MSKKLKKARIAGYVLAGLSFLPAGCQPAEKLKNRTAEVERAESAIRLYVPRAGTSQPDEFFYRRDDSILREIRELGREGGSATIEKIFLRFHVDNPIRNLDGLSGSSSGFYESSGESGARVDALSYVFGDNASALRAFEEIRSKERRFVYIENDGKRMDVPAIPMLSTNEIVAVRSGDGTSIRYAVRHVIPDSNDRTKIRHVEFPPDNEHKFHIELSRNKISVYYGLRGVEEISEYLSGRSLTTQSDK